MSVDLISHVSLNGGTVDITVHEDTDGDGTAENSETVNVADGHASYRLGTLSGGTGNAYWAEVKAGVGSASPDIFSVELETTVSASVPTPTADVSSQQVDLDWSDTGATGYSVFRSESSGASKSDYTQIASGVSGTSYSDSNKEDGERYYYRVSEDSGTLSEEISRTTPLPDPNGIAGDFTVEGEAGISWTKNDNNGSGSFDVLRSTDGSTFSQIDSVSASSTSYSDTGVSDGEKYWYKVRRDTGHSTGSTSSTSGVTVLPAASPSTTVTSNGEHSLSWNANTDVSGVRVHRSDDGGVSFSQVADLASGSNSYTSKSFGSNQARKWRVERYTGHTSTTAETYESNDGVGVGTEMSSIGEAPQDTPVSSVEDGTGTAVAFNFNGFLIDSNVDNLSSTTNSKTTGDAQSMYGSYSYDGSATLDYDTTVTRDTSVDWPVTITQDVYLDIENIEDIVEFGVNTHSQDCSADSKIKVVETVSGGRAHLKLVSKYDCDSSVTEITANTRVTAHAADTTNTTVTVTGTTVSVDQSVDGVNTTVSNASTGQSMATTTIPYQRYVGVDGACLPASESTTLDVDAFTQAAATKSYDIKLLFDPNVVRVDSVSGTSQFSVDSSTIDNTDGVLTVSASASSPVGGGLANYPLLNIDVTAVGNNGDTSDLTLISSDTILFDGNGNAIDGVTALNSNLTVSPGMMLDNAGGQYGDIVTIPVETDTGQQVAEADVEVSWPTWIGDFHDAGNGDFDTVTVADHTEGSVRESVTLETSGSGMKDATVATVDIELKDSPLTKSGERQDKREFIKFNRSTSTLYDASGNEIPVSCYRPGRLAITDSVSEIPGLKGEIPEVGVVYWPIQFSMPVEVSPVDTESFEGASVDASSTTNPDISAAVTGSTTIPEQDTVVLDVGVVIPKADTQDYPVTYELALQLQFSTSTLGGGLFIGANMRQGDTGGITKTITVGTNRGKGIGL